MKKTTLLCLPLFTLAGIMPSWAAAPSVYPKPQQSTYQGNYVPPAKITAIKRGEANADKYLKDIPSVSGAYRLIVKPDGITIAAHDNRGVFYAQQTLRQLRDESGKVAVCEISDWPDIEYRGTVEGFYGQPWSHEARISQIKFYGQTKMNTYIYGPKDDPFHSANWRAPYPEKEARQIAELAKIAKENHVDFVWSIHPGGSIKWTDEDMNNVIKKFEMMYKLGVRSFAVFFDDIGGEGTRADKQSELLNMINEQFIKKKPDVGPLVMCPTQYNRSWSSGDYLDILGNTLDKSIHVMWTGNSVVHDITLEGQEWVNKRLKRPSYVWWNFPVTDFVRNHLTLGRVYGLTQDPGARESMSGFVSNPMDKPEASKIALFGVSAYTWNINGFESDQTWKDGIKFLFPKCADAMQTFANHNSDLGPNGHGYRREESVEIAPVVAQVLEAAREGKKLPEKETATLKNEFRKIATATARINSDCGNPGFLAETGPWLKAFEELGRAGSYALSSVEGDKATAVSSLVNATSALSMINYISQASNRNPYQPGIKTGSLVIEPAVRELTQIAGDRIYSSIAGRASQAAKPITSGGNMEKAVNYCDRKKDTMWHWERNQQSGDWFGIDYGQPVIIKSVSIIMGKNDNDQNDFPDEGQLEYSADMKTWKPLGPATSGSYVAWQYDGDALLRARGLRYVIKSDKDKWLAVREFAINTTLPPVAKSNVKGKENLIVRRDNKMVGINRVMEVSDMNKGDFISLELPAPVDATWLEINVENGDLNNWGEVYLETTGSAAPIKQKVNRQGNNFIAKGPELPKGIKSVKLVNKGGTQPVAITMFKLDVPPDDPTTQSSSLNDSDLTTTYSCDKPLSVTVDNINDPAAKKAVVIGNASYAIMATKDGKTWGAIGKGTGKALNEFAIPQGTRAVKLQYGNEQPGKVLNEVIFAK